MPNTLDTNKDIREITTCSNENNDKSVKNEKLPKKRGRKPNSKRKGYFYEKEEEAFKLYVSSTDKTEKNRIFNEVLYPAFAKMIESIIRRYNLFTPDEPFEDTFCDTMSFLLTKVNNFDFSKGYKVYSYCGTVCKNYLLYKRTQYAKQKERTAFYDNTLSIDRPDNDEASNFIQSLANDMIKISASEIRRLLEGDKNKNTLTENQIKVGYALLEIIDNWEDLFEQMGSSKFNKATILFFIKEYTLLSTKEIRDALKIYKISYKESKEKLLRK